MGTCTWLPFRQGLHNQSDCDATRYRIVFEMASEDHYVPLWGIPLSGYLRVVMSCRACVLERLLLVRMPALNMSFEVAPKHSKYQQM
jgi:hypothetical protein